MSWAFERVCEPYGDPLDGPAWDGEGLLFCRPLKNEILRYDPKTQAITRARANTGARPASPSVPMERCTEPRAARAG